MPSSKRSDRGEEPIPHWGRPKVSLTSGRVNLQTHTDGHFLTDPSYRPKKRRNVVHGKPSEGPAETHGPDRPLGQTGGDTTDTIYESLLGHLDTQISYDPGYTQTERERKVRSQLVLWVIIST